MTAGRTPKATWKAYLLLVFLGVLGGHHFYLERWRSGARLVGLFLAAALLLFIGVETRSWDLPPPYWVLGAGAAGWILLLAGLVSWTRDLINLPRLVAGYNERSHE